MSEDKKDITKHGILKGYYTLLQQLGYHDHQIEPDLEILVEVVDRYWKDVERVKKYHGIERIDCHKIAGYLTYWICKLKPLKIRDYKLYENKNFALRNINEYLAFTVACGRIEEHYNSLGLKTSIKAQENFFRSYIYTLKYRPINADMLSIIYYFLDQGALGEMNL